jgi:hypothetical protein
MTDHLRPDEFVDALDDAPGASAQAHLAGCERCRNELAALRSAAGDAARVPPPVPSPLFWDHFSDRVRQATAAEDVPRAATWWDAWRRPAAVIAGAMAVITLAVVLRPVAPAPRSGGAPGAAAILESSAWVDDGSWGLVVGLAAELAWNDVKEAAEPAAGTADAMIEELTPAQREELARLLQREMGEL